MAHVGRPKLDLAVVASGRNQLGVNVVKVDAPAPLLVLLEALELGADERVPDEDAALVVAARQPALHVRVPRHAADLGVADHFAVRVVDVHHVLGDGRVVVEDLS